MLSRSGQTYVQVLAPDRYKLPVDHKVQADRAITSGRLRAQLDGPCCTTFHIVTQLCQANPEFSLGWPLEIAIVHGPKTRSILLRQVWACCT